MKRLLPLLALATAAEAEMPGAAVPILNSASKVCRADAGSEANLIVDFTQILCSLGFRLWHGTGDSRIHIVLNDGATKA